MAQEDKTALSDLIPQKAKALLAGTGKDFVHRIGVEAIKRVTSEVLCGKNLRDQTEPLTRRRISQISGALVAMFANGWVRHSDFSERMSSMAAEEMAARRKTKTDGWPARWTLGLTDKLADNVLRGDARQLPGYIHAFEQALLESAERCADDCGELTMQLGLPGQNKATHTLDWSDITRLTTALGCAALTIRGSDKSLYGKLFEKLVLGSALTVLGFRCVKRAEAKEQKMIFWLSDSEEERESDATALIRPGKVFRFDIGFIGKGNPEITKDKLSRYSREIELNGRQAKSRTIIIVDRLPRNGSIEQAAKSIGAELIQMSNKYWPAELAAKINRVEKSFQHPLIGMPEADMAAFISNAVMMVDIEDFVGRLKIDAVEMEHDDASSNEVDATLRIDADD